MAGFGYQDDKHKQSKARHKSKKKGKEFHQKALDHHRQGDYTNAERAYREALKTGYSHEHIFSNLGVICKNSGRQEEAIYLYKKAIKLCPDSSDIYNNIGNLYKQLGDLNQALENTLKSIELQPDNPTAHMHIGGIYQDLGNPDLALTSTLKSLQLNPNNSNAHMQLGSIYNDLGEVNQALNSTLRSLELNPENHNAQMNLGGIYKELGNLDQALAYTLKSLQLNPNNPNPYVNLGSIYQDLGNLDQALSYTLKSLKLAPNDPTACMNLGGIYKELGNLDQALAYTLKSIHLNPYNPIAHINLSHIQQSMGDIKDSTESTKKALDIEPHLPEGLYKLSLELEDNTNALSLLNTIGEIDSTKLLASKSSLIEFAKLNCFDKLKDYKKASESLIKANKLKISQKPSNAAALIKIIRANANTSTDKGEIMNAQKHEHLFIVGVPRSGSTLISKILNVNPSTVDIGESLALPKAISTCSDHNTRDKKQELAWIYSKNISQNVPSESIVLDKNLYNFIYCNQIATLIPNAKIIHATRNPMDNILSMLKSNLISGNNFTSSVEGSARVLIEQEIAMRTFKERFPGKIYTYSYDKLVTNPIHQTQKLLEWLDWKWSDSYLRFHENKQIINTASVLQARQPVNNKSVGGWRNYSEVLEKARKILLESNLFPIELLEAAP